MSPVGVAAVALGAAELTESSVMLDGMEGAVELAGGAIMDVLLSGDVIAAVELAGEVEAAVELS